MPPVGLVPNGRSSWELTVYETHFWRPSLLGPLPYRALGACTSEEPAGWKRKRPDSPTKPGAYSIPGLRVHNQSRMKPGSPWDRYRKIFEVKLETYVTVATRKNRLVSVKAFEGSDGHSKLHMLEKIHHDRL